MSEHQTVARFFAETVTVLARRTDTVPDWAATLFRLRGVVCPTTIEPITGPRSITEQQIRDCLDGAGQPLSEEQRKFVVFLADSGRLDVLPEIAELFAEQFGIPSNAPSGEPDSMPSVPDPEQGSLRPENRGDMPRLHGSDDSGTQEAQDSPSMLEDHSFSAFKLLDLDAVPVLVPEVIDVRAGIETMPRLQSRICGIWGTQELDMFLNQLVMDSRDGARSGFPVEVAAEILFLTKLNKVVRACDLAKVTSIKFNAAFKAVDEGDEARHKHDVWDNPNSSPGTAFRGAPKGSRTYRDESAGHGNWLISLFMFLVKLVLNKWVIGGIAIVLTVKFVWRG